MFLRRTGCTSLEREEHTKQALAIGALEFKTPRYLVGDRGDWELGKNSFELPPMSNPSCHNYHWQFEHLHWMLASATHSIYVRTVSKCLLSTLLIQLKLVYGSFGHHAHFYQQGNKQMYLKVRYNFETTFGIFGFFQKTNERIRVFFA